LNTARFNHTATLLTVGQVVIAGGLNSCATSCLSDGTTEVFDPSTGMFTSSQAACVVVKARTVGFCQPQASFPGCTLSDVQQLASMPFLGRTRTLKSLPTPERWGFIDSCRTNLGPGYRVAAAHRCSGVPVFQSKPSSGTTMSRSKVSILMSKYFSVGGAHAKFS
jgi:hypothetical protein